jgi:outer membrane receptor protein involved in Fe transport
MIPLHTKQQIAVITFLCLIGPNLHAQESAEDANTEWSLIAPTEMSETAETAETASSDNEETDDVFTVVPQFTVSAEQDRGYYSANSVSATRTNALVKNTPITLTVINEQLLADLNILNDQDLVRATSSVTADPDGFSLNQLRIRGFRSLTQRYDLFWREIERDSYNIQRVDIVKGANSLMYGQADPGGQINSIPKVAQHNKNSASFKGTVGNKDYLRGEFDINQVITEDFAIRVMGVDFSRDLDQQYEYVEQQGATVELSYRPTKKSQLRAHIEYINVDQNLAPGMFRSTANDSRFAPNSRASETDNNEVFSLGAYRNEFIYSPDAIDNIPQGIIDDLVLSDGYATQIGLANSDDVTRDILKQMYAPWADQDDLYSVTGPDKYNSREGIVTTFDWTQEFTDSLQMKIAFNREATDRESLARDGYSAGRVQSDATGARAYDPYVRTFWRKQDGETEANALKSTLLWDIEFGDDLPVFGNSEHKILFGVDWDQLVRNPRMYEQLQEGATLEDGQYYNGGDLFYNTFYLSDGFGPNTPNIGYNGRDDLFVLRQDNEFESQTSSLWLAAQSSFLDGRLRSLIGVRYDYIDIDYSIDDKKTSVNDNFVNNNLGGDFSRAVTRIEETNQKFDQVSPSVGVLYWITDEVAAFANYAKSIQSPTNIDVDPLGELIPPVYGEGYEYGFRFDLFDQKLTGQITAFYIEKENDNIVNYDFRLGDIYTFAEYGQSNPQIFNSSGQLVNNLLPGSQVPGDISRSEGLEVEFFYNPNRNLSFTLSYTYNNLDAIKINEKVNPKFAQVFGQAPHNLLLIGRYKFTEGVLRGLTIGANQSFRSSSTIGQWYIEDDNDPVGGGTWYDIEFDPEYVTDAFINYQYKMGKKRNSPILNLGLRVNNLWDNTDLINRNKSAFHRSSRQYLLSANVRF